MRRVALAIVTGAGSGIGRAAALELARRGLDVALLGRREPPLQSTAQQAEAMGVRAHVLRADVTVEAHVARVAADLEAFPAPAVLVNSAGIAGRRAPIEDTSVREWEAVLTTNLTGVFLMTRAFLPRMRAAGRGRFVTVASISATLGTAGLAPYVSSKWGAVGFTKSLAEELRGSGLQAMAVLPGSVDTPMVRVGGFAPQMSPEDVARLIAFAALDAPDAMNASAIECFGP